MSVVGIDFGNNSCRVAIAREKGIDVAINNLSERETPAVIWFGDQQIYIGAADAAAAMTNPNIAPVSQIKRLIGRKFSDPVLQRDLLQLPLKVTEGPDGYPLIIVQYLGEARSFTPTQVLEMLFANLKQTAEINLDSAFVDCCIAVPVYFTDLQRKAIVNAASIVGLHPLHLIHETTATALAYGFYRTNFPKNKQLNVAFVDFGHASMQVCIASYNKGQLKILSHAFDQALGGRDFDEALFQHFAARLRREYGFNVIENAVACLHLRESCENLKKDLEENYWAPLSIEGLMEGIDVTWTLSLRDFEAVSFPILKRVKGPLVNALAQARLAVDNVHKVEVAGLGSRVPAVLKIISDFFGKKPRRTMNSRECVAKGAALHCAILSPTLRVEEFQVNESFPFSVALTWKGTTPDTQLLEAGNSQGTVLFPHKKSVPSVQPFPFYRSGTVRVDVQHADASELQAPARISTFMIGPIQSSSSESAKLEVRVQINLDGIVSAVSASLLEEEVKVPVIEEPSIIETDDDAANNETDVIMQAGSAKNGASEWCAHMGPDSEAEIQQKKTNVPIARVVYGDDSTYTFMAHTDGLYAVACCPTDPHLVATGGGDEKAFLWKIGGDCEIELTGHRGSVTCLAFSNDGMLLASGDLDGIVKVWDIPSGNLKHTMIGPGGGIEWLRWHPRKHQLMAGSGVPLLFMWNADTGKLLNTFEGHTGYSTCCDFTPDGNLMCSGSDDATLRIWNPESADTLHVVRGHSYHTEGLNCMALEASSSSYTLAVTGSNDGSVRVVNINTGEVVTSLISRLDPAHPETAHSDSVECVGLAPSSPLAATGGFDRKLIVWDLEKFVHVSVCYHPHGVTCLAWLGSSRYIVTGCLDGKVRVWDSLSGECAKTFSGHWNAVYDLAVSVNLDYIVSSSLDGTARVFKTHDLKQQLLSCP